MDVESGIVISADSDKLSVQAFCMMSRLSFVQLASLQAWQLSKVSLKYICIN